MNSPDPFSHELIASPDGRVSPLRPVQLVEPGNWETAPPIVRSARNLHIFNVCVLVALFAWVIVIAISSPKPSQSSSLDSDVLLGFGILAGMTVLFGLHCWLVFALRRGKPSAWAGQILTSAIGILNFPLGTLMNGYILSQWFNPHVKGWFKAD